MRSPARIGFLVLLPLVAFVCVVWTLTGGNRMLDHGTLLSQHNSEVSAVQKRTRRSTAQPRGVAPRRYGGTDPSLGPDGKPYPVPEYLRNQCYVDEGYGRFSACNNRN